MKTKKITAILLASLMGISTVPANVWAADSYKETEKAAITKAIQTMCAEYAEDLSQIQDELKGNADIKLSLDDGGKAILGMLSSVDISWLQDVSLTSNVEMRESGLTELMDVNVNGTKICTVEYYMDTASSEVYMRIPELNDGYIKMNLEDMTEEAQDELDEADQSFSASMDVSEAISSYFSSLENLPAADVLETVLTRYTGVILDNVADQEGTGAQAEAAGGVSQELTMLEGHVTQKEAQPMLLAVIDAAKEDEELKGLIETWTAALNDPAYTYDAFLDALGSLEEEISGPLDDTDGSGFILRAWVDENGEVVGRQVAATDGDGSEQNFLRYLCTSDGDNRGLSIQIDGNSEDIVLEGSGILSGDLLNGTYTISSNGTEAAVIDVADYDTKAMEEDMWKATYTISGAQITDEDGYTYDTLGGLQVVVSFDAEDKDNATISLSVLTGGASLGTLTITGGDKGEGVTPLDVASLTDVYDFSVDADVESYGASVNLDAITANLTAAGMPDGFLNSLMGTEEDGTAEDATTDMAGDTLDSTEEPAA